MAAWEADVMKSCILYVGSLWDVAESGDMRGVCVAGTVELIGAEKADFTCSPAIQRRAVSLHIHGGWEKTAEETSGICSQAAPWCDIIRNLC